MDNDQPLNESESLAIIQNMIHKAQGSVKDHSFYFLLWGWLVFSAATIQYGMIQTGYAMHSGLTWAILMPLGGIISWIRGYSEAKKEKVKTYTGELLRYVSIAFMVALFIVIFYGAINDQKNGWAVSYPLIMMVYGMWLFISGGALKFTPLIVGGIINWLCCIGCFFIHSNEIILVLAFAVLAGYIIPGHLLKAKFRKENQ